jgi:hypothetical protein
VGWTKAKSSKTWACKHGLDTREWAWADRDAQLKHHTFKHVGTNVALHKPRDRNSAPSSDTYSDSDFASATRREALRLHWQHEAGPQGWSKTQSDLVPGSPTCQGTPDPGPSVELELRLLTGLSTTTRACSTGSRRRPVGSRTDTAVTEPGCAPTASIVTTPRILCDQGSEQSDAPR